MSSAAPDEFWPCKLSLTPGEPIAPRDLPTHGGVYLVVDADARPILLATCEDLRRVVPARLAAPQPDEKSRRARLGEIAAGLWWRPTFSAFESTLRHLDAARRLYPANYRKLIGFGPAWFVSGDPNEPIPRLRTMSALPASVARAIGPYATRGDAEAVLALLEELFDLCRKYDVLRRAPQGQPCEYLEMGKCPAPCDGRWPMEAYRASIGLALDFAAGRRDERLAQLTQRMRQEAATQRYEAAQRTKQLLERAAGHFARPELRWAREWESSRFLILQRGGPRSRSRKMLRVKPFFVWPRAIEEGAAVTLAELPSAAEAWLERIRGAAPIASADATTSSEQAGCVAHFLFKPAAPGLYYAGDSLPDTARLSEEAARRFLAAEATAAPTDDS